jgi:anti-sigma factor RsiW
VAERHDAHDLAAVVAFADGELAGPELDAAATQIGECPDCALLASDLRALAYADRSLATPARPRDFRLTARDAERLARPGPEPLAAPARLSHDMTSTPATHATHDPELIAAAVGGPLDPSERRAIDDLLATCGACAELHADLVALASAQRALPTPSRPRDFRLTPTDAQRLRPRGLRAVLAAIGSSRDAFSKPLAVGLTTLGLVGLLVGNVPSFGIGGSASLSTVGAESNADGNAKSTYPDGFAEGSGDGTVFGGQDDPPTAAPAAAASVAPSAPAPSAAAVAAPDSAASSAGLPVAPLTRSEPPREAASPVGDTMGDGGTAIAGDMANEDAARLASGARGSSPVLVGSLLLLLAGIALFAARWGAGRLRAS